MLYPPEARTLDAARRLATTLPPNDTHTVAAAAMDTTGRIHTGVNVHHFTGGPCAELVVLGVAAAAHAGPLVTIAAVGDNGRDVLAPCGRCRQVLLDLHPDVRVVLPGPQDAPIHHLLPHAYRHPDAAPERLVRFSPAYYDAVLDGRKSATLRWDDPVEPGPAWLLFEDDDQYRRLPGVVEQVTPVRLEQLTRQDLDRENATDLDSLRAGLRGHYPDLPEDAVLDLVTFHLHEP